MLVNRLVDIVSSYIIGLAAGANSAKSYRANFRFLGSSRFNEDRSYR